MGVRLDRQQPFLGMHAVNVYVHDQDESLRFYVDQLGFHLAFDARLHTGDRWIAVAPPDGTAVLSLIAPKPESREYRLIGRPTGIVFVTEDVVAKFEEWRKRGVRFLFTPRLRRVKYEPGWTSGHSAATPEGTSPVWGGIFTRFMDIDGNSFALVGFDEVNRQIEAQRQQIAGKLESERRAAQELEIAKQVQARLFPQRLPPFDTLEYAGICIQARQVGGDYYDFLDLGRGRFGLVIADISGKGMAAALLMANLQANLRSQCAIAVDELERLLCSVNQLLFENTSESAYATLFFAEYEDSLRRLRYANCGHLAALLLRRGGAVERLDSTCTVLGSSRSGIAPWRSASSSPETRWHSTPTASPSRSITPARSSESGVWPKPCAGIGTSRSTPRSHRLSTRSGVSARSNSTTTSRSSWPGAAETQAEGRGASRDPHRFDIDELADPVAAQLPAVARALHAAERQSRIRRHHAVDEHHPRLDLVDESRLLPGRRWSRRWRPARTACRSRAAMASSRSRRAEEHRHRAEHSSRVGRRTSGGHRRAPSARR